MATRRNRDLDFTENLVETMIKGRNQKIKENSGYGFDTEYESIIYLNLS